MLGCWRGTSSSKVQGSKAAANWWYNHVIRSYIGGLRSQYLAIHVKTKAQRETYVNSRAACVAEALIGELPRTAADDRI